MASETLSSIVGGGGLFVAKTITGTLIIAPGATGLLATITPPSGQRVKLTGLSADGASPQSGISVAFGGADIITEKSLEGLTSATPLQSVDEFKIGHGTSNHTFIIGEVDAAVTITKDSGNTVQGILYAYEFGVIA